MKAFIVIFIAALIAQGESLKCYQCSDCADLSGKESSSCVFTTTTEPPSTTASNTEEPTTTLTPTTSPPTTSPPTTSPPTTTPSTIQTDETIATETTDFNNLLKSYRSVLRHRRDAPSEVQACFSIDVTENDKTRTERGCVNYADGLNGCDVVKEKFSENTANCRVCQNDDCNSSAMARLSLFGFMLTFLIKFII